VTTLTSRVVRDWFATTENDTAARCPLYASRDSLQDVGTNLCSVKGTTLAFSPNRAEVCPAVGSYQRAAFSGQRVAA